MPPTPKLLSPCSPGGGGGARGAGRRGLHGGWNRRLLLSGQDDVSGRGGQWGRSCRRQPGGHSPVRGGSWTLHIIQHPPGLRWISFWGFAWRSQKGTSFPSSRWTQTCRGAARRKCTPSRTSKTPTRAREV